MIGLGTQIVRSMCTPPNVLIIFTLFATLTYYTLTARSESKQEHDSAA